jgi:hypothetical protein
MKKFLRNVYLVMKGFGYARAAANAARNGNREKAVQLMQEYDKCK